MKGQLCCFLLLALAACSKDDPEASLPAATHTGANTAGCRINGQVFVASGWGSGPGKVKGIGGGFAYDSAYYLRLNGKFGDREGSLHLFLDGFPSNRNQKLIRPYSLNQNTPVLPAAISSQCKSYAAFFPNDSRQEVYSTDASHTGQVNITYVDLSTLNNTVIAGTFEFTAVSNLDPTRTLTVTEGRFDRKQ
ncbi:DUF6252 family protein [Hymenobacter convexus]|uniref:DUF6252 family protein n=1 Tax=Hymenobacter sp. CA1UV-4 TaxID=3063782 RepID=UPI0027142119|nr:DUF6252 family protein [Hymenobacter sp. CA1UV-4]MDO7852975.1 DUF6252 family protein [Hymenobacter sp. CA1UV-4]